MTKQLRYIGTWVCASWMMAALSACAGEPPAAPTEQASPTSSSSAAVLEACSTGASRPFDQAPISGSPIAVAASGITAFEAEHFNCGGEGQGYHDTTTTNNPGQTFRADEGVEVTAVSPSGLATNQFDIGEWTAYTINVAAAGTYELAVLASSSPSGGGTGAFRIEIDGSDATGSVSVPVTTGWDDYQWVTRPGVALTAGLHTLRLVALGTYFRSDKLRLVAAPVSCNTGGSRPFDQAPVSGSPIAVAGSGATMFEAEHFNCGGEGQGYHDTTTTNNPGQTFRVDEGVEIIAVSPSGLATNQFDIGEWTAYTINVAAAGTYELAVLASSSPSGGGTGAFRIEIDGSDATGSVSVPVTTGWDDYQWVTRTGVSLTAGLHTLRLVALGTYFRSDKLRIVASIPSTGDDCSRPGVDLCFRFEAAPDTRFQGIDFSCNSAGRCNEVALLSVGGASITTTVLNQANNQCNGDRADDTTRIARVSGARDGSSALKFTTQDLDNQVHTSVCGNTPDPGTWERSMLEITKATTAASQGTEQWWAHSIYLPPGFTMPPDAFNANLFIEFHRTWIDAPGGSLPMISLNLFNQPGDNPHVVFRVNANGAGGVPNETDGRQYTYSVPGRARIGGQCIFDNPTTGVWYDFVHHIRFSATGDGFHEIWMREGSGPTRKVLDKRNINVLINTAEQSYLVIGVYHDPQPGITTSIIHDRIRRGNSFAAVAMTDFQMPTGGVTMCAGATVP